MLIPRPMPPRTDLGWILVVAPLVAVINLGMDGYLTALPTVAASFHGADSGAQASVTFFLLAVAVGQLVAGPISDQIGRRPMILTGLGLFGLVSLAAAASPSLGVLIALRVPAGIGVGVVVVVATAVIRDRFSGARAARAFSQFQFVIGAAPVLVPLASAVVLGLLGWRGLMVFFAAATAALGLLALLRVPETNLSPHRDRAWARRLVGDGRALAADRQFVGFALAVAALTAAIFFMMTALSFVLQNDYGFTAVQYSLVIGANAFGCAVTSYLGGRLAMRVGPRRLAAFGLVEMCVGTAVVVAAAAAGLPVGVLLVGQWVMVASSGFLLPAARTLAPSAHQSRAGSAFAIMGLLQYAAGGLAAPLMTVVPESGPSAIALVTGVLTGATVVLAALAMTGRRARLPERRPLGR